ncbi:hypothetical protein [Pedobacter aquatilis]|uniref:hypothetical protein n=1 Tax=Pedobacter aquatilis TaxID=351343 RepID=UPI00293192E6|nr:hypothetical protein [Pedobacter aquatilis]
MKSILTDADYKKIINRITSLSEQTNELNNSFTELNHLRQMAMDYERRKYDFTLHVNKDYFWPVAR